VFTDHYGGAPAPVLRPAQLGMGPCLGRWNESARTSVFHTDLERGVLKCMVALHKVILVGNSGVIPAILKKSEGNNRNL